MFLRFFHNPLLLAKLAWYEYLIKGNKKQSTAEYKIKRIIQDVTGEKIDDIVVYNCGLSTPKLAKNGFQATAIYLEKYNELLVIFRGTELDETVALLSKLDVDKHIDVEIKLDELDLTSAESKATYAQIKEYILEKFDLKVSTLYIAQIKKKCGIVLREHYNKSKKEKQVIPQCTPEKEEAIMDALRHFKMI